MHANVYMQMDLFFCKLEVFLGNVNKKKKPGGGH